MRWATWGLALVLAACSGTPPVSTSLPQVGPSSEGPPAGHEIVAGGDRTALFALPTSAEVDSARNLVPSLPTPAAVSVTSTAPAADGARQFIIALDDDRQRVATAVARVPGPAAATTALPTIVVLTDGTDGASADDLLTGDGYARLVDQTVQVVVAYRGEPLAVAGETIGSDLPADPYVSDVADALAFVDGLATIPRVDTTRVAFVGLGRGGTVALLAGGASGVGAIVTLGAPTDLLATSFRDAVRSLLRGTSPQDPYPALAALAAPALGVRDGTTPLADARLGLLARSPARTAQGLPPVFALHADGDRVVGEDQLGALQALLSGSALQGITLLVEDTTHDDLGQLPSVRDDVSQFILRTLAP